MKKIEIDELRELQMHILDYVDSFCRKNGIEYTISGGSLLGAIRHGGFIPWDDDVDIQMIREVYDHFTKIWNQSSHYPYRLINIESSNSMGYPFGKIEDQRTVTYVHGVARTGVFIDVFPVDNVLDDKDFLIRHKKIRRLYNRLFAAYALESRRINPINLAKRIRLFIIAGFYTRKQYAVIINNLAQNKRSITCPFVYEMIAGARCKRPIPKEVFDEYNDIIFENRVYRSVKNTDLYLSLTFGNYMQLPPLEKQVRVHDFDPFWK